MSKIGRDIYPENLECIRAVARVLGCEVTMQDWGVGDEPYLYDPFVCIEQDSVRVCYTVEMKHPEAFSLLQEHFKMALVEPHSGTQYWVLEVENDC